MIDVSQVPLRRFVEADTTRLISTAYIDEPSLAPLVDAEDELSFLEDLEGLSLARRGRPEYIPADVRRDELVTEHHGYGWSYINAAFCYTRETGNRFNSPTRGAWYATWQDKRIKAAQAEVAWHLTQELHAIGVYENVTAYRELNASFATSFHDLSAYAGEDIFHPDPAIGYLWTASGGSTSQYRFGRCALPVSPALGWTLPCSVSAKSCPGYPPRGQLDFRMVRITPACHQKNEQLNLSNANKNHTSRFLRPYPPIPLGAFPDGLWIGLVSIRPLGCHATTVSH